LNNGNTKSCGCLSIDKAKEQGKQSAKIKDTPISKTKAYKVWCDMKARCYDINNDHYKDYGGRGIKICNEWINDSLAFYNWAKLNGYKKGLKIDRINNNGNYEPNNCKWSTQKEQCNNTRSNKLIEFNNKIQTQQQWTEELNFSKDLIYSRLKRGWSIERTLTTKHRR
jgi:hypothetical protein